MPSFKGAIEYSKEEKEMYARYSGTISKVARRFLEDRWSDHVTFYEQHRVSKYYGARNKGLDTPEELSAALREAGAPAEIITQLKPTSCIGLCFEALGAGFRATGDPTMVNVWNTAERYTRSNGSDGSALLDALQKLGWKICYWNPSPEKNEQWDAEDLKNGKQTSDGLHAYWFKQVMTTGRYYMNLVDDKSSLAGFGTRVPSSFRDEPFFVGVAHAGYHVFPGFKGEIIEAHSMRRLDSKDNLEKSSFNPLAKGGGPRWTATEKYRSGIIGIPPKQIEGEA